MRRKNSSSTQIPSPAASRARPDHRIGVHGGHVIWWRGMHVQRPKMVPPPHPVPLRVSLYDGPSAWPTHRLTARPHRMGCESGARHRPLGNRGLERDWFRCHAPWSGACLQRRRSRPHRTVSSRAISPDELPDSYDNSEGSVAIPCVAIRKDSARINPIHLFVENNA